MLQMNIQESGLHIFHTSLETNKFSSENFLHKSSRKNLCRCDRLTKMTNTELLNYAWPR